jgi:hypothetical protein
VSEYMLIFWLNLVEKSGLVMSTSDGNVSWPS